MKRRNFIAGLIATPFVAKALAEESAVPVNVMPAELPCFSNGDCQAECYCDPEGGKCMPALRDVEWEAMKSIKEDGFVGFDIPMTRMNWEMKIDPGPGGWEWIRYRNAFRRKSERNMAKYMARLNSRR